MEKIKSVNAEVIDEIIASLKRIEEEVSSTIESIEILYDSEILQSIKRGIDDIKRGNVKSFEDFVNEL